MLDYYLLLFTAKTSFYSLNIMTGEFLTHSELPLPIRFKDTDSSNDDILLQSFINTCSDSATKFTIDDDNIRRVLVCAFLHHDDIKGVMVYSKKTRFKII
jgi:hypothetical protein